MFNYQALAIAAGGLYVAGRKSAEVYAESQSRAVASEHALTLEKIGR